MVWILGGPLRLMERAVVLNGSEIFAILIQSIILIV